jgi:hypothetical protein
MIELLPVGFVPPDLGLFRQMMRPSIASAHCALMMIDVRPWRAIAHFDSHLKSLSFCPLGSFRRSAK